MIVNKNINGPSIRSIIRDFICESVSDDPEKLRVLILMIP